MKYIWFFFFLLCSQLSFSQELNDRIYSKKGDTIVCFIKDITPRFIQYNYRHKKSIRYLQINLDDVEKYLRGNVLVDSVPKAKFYEIDSQYDDVNTVPKESSSGTDEYNTIDSSYYRSIKGEYHYTSYRYQKFVGDPGHLKLADGKKVYMGSVLEFGNKYISYEKVKFENVSTFEKRIVNGKLKLFALPRKVRSSEMQPWERMLSGIGRMSYGGGYILGGNIITPAYFSIFPSHSIFSRTPVGQRFLLKKGDEETTYASFKNIKQALADNPACVGPLESYMYHNIFLNASLPIAGASLIGGFALVNTHYNFDDSVGALTPGIFLLGTSAVSIITFVALRSTKKRHLAKVVSSYQ